MSNSNDSTPPSKRTPIAAAIVRDNAFTFDGPDDFGMAAVIRGINAMDAQAVHSACGITLLQLADALVHCAGNNSHGLVAATIEAAVHNHNYLWAQYQRAAAATGATGEEQSTMQMQYLNGLWSALTDAIPVAYAPLTWTEREAMVPRLQSAAFERESIAAVFRQGFQDAELANRSDLAAVYLHAMATADFMYAACVGCILRVTSPEMWPTPPEVWKPHRRSLASVESARRTVVATGDSITGGSALH